MQAQHPLTEKQWKNVVFDNLGIHGDNNATAVTGTGASFCMGGELYNQLAQAGPVRTEYFAAQDRLTYLLGLMPADWNTKLITTIEWILGFPNTTHLMIVTDSQCDEVGYAGVPFPKGCSGAKYLSSISVAGRSAEELADWVIANIPR